VALSDHWYEVIQDATLRQGDIFRSARAIQLPQGMVVPTQAGDALQSQFELVVEDLIVLDASCDVDYSLQRQAACQQVLLAAVRYASKEALKATTDKDYRTRLEVIRRGLMNGRFLLPDHQGVDPHLPFSFVQYHARVLVPHQYLVSLCNTPRLRLRSPHRESFGSWVASCIGRVGPEDASQIPRFVDQLHAGQVVAAGDAGNT